MSLPLLIGIGGGLATAIICYSAFSGGGGLGLLLLLLTPLPSLLAGLGWGMPAAVASAAASSSIIALGLTLKLGIGVLIVIGLPIIVLSHFASLARVRAEPAPPEWFPVGRLIAILGLLAAAVPILVLPLFGGSYAIMEPKLTLFVRDLFERLGQPVGPPGQFSPVVQDFAHTMIDWMPGILASYWGVIFAANLYIAGRILQASGRLHRTWPDLHAIVLPGALAILVAVGIASVLVPGESRTLGAALVGGLAVAYVLGGLSVVHSLVRGSWRPLLWPLYLTIPFLGPYTMGLAALIGLAEPLLDLRRRLGGAKPPPPPA